MSPNEPPAGGLLTEEKRKAKTKIPLKRKSPDKKAMSSYTASKSNPTFDSASLNDRHTTTKKKRRKILL